MPPVPLRPAAPPCAVQRWRRPAGCTAALGLCTVSLGLKDVAGRQDCSVFSPLNWKSQLHAVQKKRDAFGPRACGHVK